MKSGRFVLLDLFLYFLVYGNLLTIYNLFNSLAFSVLLSNLSGNLNALASVVTILPCCNRLVTWFLSIAFL